MSYQPIEPSFNESDPSGLTPPPREPYRSSLLEDLGQGWAFVQFVWRISKRIRGSKNRIRFIIGLIFWKPFLPDDQ